MLNIVLISGCENRREISANTLKFCIESKEENVAVCPQANGFLADPT